MSIPRVHDIPIVIRWDHSAEGDGWQYWTARKFRTRRRIAPDNIIVRICSGNLIGRYVGRHKDASVRRSYQCRKLSGRLLSFPKYLKLGIGGIIGDQLECGQLSWNSIETVDHVIG